MYVVFGVFALALFGITRTWNSYATDGLMIDNALDSIVLYWEVEQLAEDEEVEEVLEERVKEVEKAPDDMKSESEEKKEITWDENSQDLEDVNFGKDENDDKEEDKENKEVSNEIENDENEIISEDDKETAESKEEIEKIEETEKIEENNTNQETHWVRDENINNWQENILLQQNEESKFIKMNKEESIKTMTEKTAELLDGSWFNVEIKKLANNNSSEMTFNTDDTNIEKIIIADTNTEWSSVIVSSSTSENPVYAWYDWNEKAIYLYSEAKTIYLNEDSSFMFYKLKWLRWFQINMFDITKVKSMKYMFWFYQWEEAVDLRNLDLSKVEDMSFMYYWSNITSINLSWMDLNNVTTMMDFLYKANNLESADFTNVQLNSVTDIDTMFPNNEPEAKLEEVKFTNAQLWALERIGPSLFYKLNNLEYIDFSGVDLHNLKKPWTMFNENNNLKYVNFDYADLRSLEELWIFNNLPELTWLKFSHTILSWLQYSNYYLVHQTPKLKEIDFSYADLRNLKGRTKDSYETLKWVIEIQNGYAPNVEIFNFSNADLRSITTLQSMFSQTTTLKEVNFENTRLDNLITMEDMFKGAKLPEKIKFKNNNTNNLKNMKEMFYNSYSWNFIDLSWLDLSSVGTMYQMFKNAKDIKKVSFKNANLKKVWTMENMFYEAKDIEEVDFEWAEFENLVTMKGMFEESNIKEFNFTGKELRNLANASNMFYNSNIEKVDFSNTKFSSNTSMWTMFGSASKLKEAIFKNFEAGWSMNSVFQNCTRLEKIDFSNATILSPNMGTFVYQADNLKEVNFSNSIFNGNWNYWSLISNAPNLEKADFSNTVFSWWGNMYTFFYQTERLKEANFSWTKFIWNYVLQWMFADKPNLESIKFENSEINWAMNMKEMFKDTTKLEELDLSSWDTSISTDMNSMFKWATNLKTIYVWDNFKTTSVTDSEDMFSWTVAIVWWNGTTFNPDKIDWEYARIDTNAISWYFTNILDKPYTITYHTNEWILSWEKTTYTQRDSFILPTPIRTWYTFLWWTWSNWDEPETTVNIAKYTKWDLEYTANWKINQYKIIFDTDWWNEINPIEKDYNSLINITLPTPTKECNVFSWWDTELPETMPAHDITLKAIWNYTCSRSSWGWWRKSETTTREIAIDTNTENKHNSANEKENEIEISEEDKTTLNDETSNQVISVMQEISEDGTVEAVVETVKIRNTDIIATVRTEVNPSDSSSSSSSSTTHTKEQNDAYSFAKSNWITSTSTIKTAKMDTELTRIQMAKMVSNYAINVLGQEPDTSKWTVEFKDVTEEMDKQYDNAVTKAYQLWIMWQNVNDNKFRPNDEVSRAEFSATLSRLLYHTEEWKYRWTWKYYVPHIAKLYNEWIINKVIPTMKEKRWYVMTMLMRTVK